MTQTTAQRPAAVTAQARSVPRSSGDPQRTALAFIAPFGVLYLLFILGPLLYGVASSLFSTSLVRPGLGSWIGLRNYAACSATPRSGGRCATRCCSPR